MPALVGYLLLFVLVGVGFILVHLVVGKLIRPAKPDTEKLTIYECGEPTIGSAWVQFDLRYYVVALLFVIFDVEVAFFFPWAVVFGRANALGNPTLTAEQRAAVTAELVTSPAGDPMQQMVTQRGQLQAQRQELMAAAQPDDAAIGRIDEQLRALDRDLAAATVRNQQAAKQIGWIAFVDILVFFGVLLVGFAYLWKRGDINWVRSIAAERVERQPGPPPSRPAAELAGASQS